MSSQNGKTYEQMQQLLSKIQLNRNPSHLQQKQNSEVLLNLAEQQNYLYGQAIAHVQLARYFLSINEKENYLFHLNRAKAIGERQDYYDVLMDCFKLEGAYYINICDDISAFGSYVEGLQSSIKLNDHKSTAIFYNNLAEIFLANEAYEDAEVYYLKSLEIISLIQNKEVGYYHMLIFLNLAILYCDTKNLDKAREYLNKCKDMLNNQELLQAIYNNVEIRLEILHDKNGLVINRIHSFLDEIEQMTENPVELVQYLLDSILILGDKKCAMRTLDILYKFDWGNLKTKLAIKRLCVMCFEEFGLGDESVYESFFNCTMDLKEMTQTVNKESLKNMINLYHASKQQKRILEKEMFLRKVVDRDELTGLYNRRYYSKLLSKYINDKKTKMIAYMMIDVDYFKTYNDTCGHAMGDYILCHIANCIKTHLPAEAVCSRYGGDEFSCLFVNNTNEDIIGFIKNVQKELVKLFESDDQIQQQITLSFGFVNHDMVDEIDEEWLIERSDLALYEAKKEGRNTYEIYRE